MSVDLGTTTSTVASMTMSFLEVMLQMKRANLRKIANNNMSLDTWPFFFDFQSYDTGVFKDSISYIVFIYYILIIHTS